MRVKRGFERCRVNYLLSVAICMFARFTHMIESFHAVFTMSPKTTSALSRHLCAASQVLPANKAPKRTEQAYVVWSPRVATDLILALIESLRTKSFVTIQILLPRPSLRRIVTRGGVSSLKHLEADLSVRQSIGWSVCLCAGLSVCAPVCHFACFLCACNEKRVHE